MNKKQLLDDMREIAESDVAKHADELIEQWAQTWNAFQPVATTQLTPAQQQSWNNFWNVQARAMQREQEPTTELQGPGDGVTTCSTCGYKLTELFMSKACDRCDGLLALPIPPQSAFIRYALCLMDTDEVQKSEPIYAPRTVPTREEAVEWADKIRVQYPSDRLGILTIKMGECTHVDRLIWNEEQRRDASDSLILLLEGNV